MTAAGSDSAGGRSARPDAERQKASIHDGEKKKKARSSALNCARSPHCGLRHDVVERGERVPRCRQNGDDPQGRRCAHGLHGFLHELSPSSIRTRRIEREEMPVRPPSQMCGVGLETEVQPDMARNVVPVIAPDGCRQHGVQSEAIENFLLPLRRYGHNLDGRSSSVQLFTMPGAEAAKSGSSGRHRTFLLHHV